MIPWRGYFGEAVGAGNGSPGLGGTRLGAFTAAVLASRLAGCATASVEGIAAAPQSQVIALGCSCFPLKVEDLTHPPSDAPECYLPDRVAQYLLAVLSA